MSSNTEQIEFTTTTLPSTAESLAFKAAVARDVFPEGTDAETLESYTAAIEQVWLAHLPKPQVVVQPAAPMTVGATTIPMAAPQRKKSAWQAFQEEQKALNSAEYAAASNKSSYCSALYKQLYPTKEAKAQYLAQYNAKHPQQAAQVLPQGFVAAAPQAFAAPQAAKKARVSAWDQYQREFYAAKRAALAPGEKLDMTALRPELSAAWKAVPAAEKDALKARCQAHNAGADQIPVA